MTIARRSGSGLFLHDVLRRDDTQRVETAAVRTEHTKLDAVHDESLSTSRQSPEEVRREPADRVELIVAELRAEVVVELRDTRLTAYRELPLAFAANVEIFVRVVLIADVADDLLEHIFDRDEPGDAAVLIDDDRHVMMADAKLLEQHVEALALRNESRGT